ncbi:MAG TPA: SMP-30/gluconolactonase/LRE family protein [Polyangiaceae bacterium]|nr:SMP-30/gluconolactonase/LRE family protein [Polyangiaceae bacterium]
MNIECLWQVGAQVGESPLWVPSENALYFVDIYGDVLHRYHPESGEKRSQPATARLSALVPLKSGGFLGSAQHSVGKVDVTTGKLDSWATLSNEPATNRLNDGKCSPQGFYYTGSMDDTKQRSSGSLYLMDGSRTLRAIDSGYTITNGPAFSPDGRVMYHADTTGHVLYRFAVESDGTLTGKLAFLHFTAETGRPDGMTTDTDGGLWVAHAAGSCIKRYSPEGKVLQVIQLPVTKVTSMAFGGADYRTLFITSACIGLSTQELQAQPLAGALFATVPGVQGLPAAAYG